MTPEPMPTEAMPPEAIPLMPLEHYRRPVRQHVTPLVLPARVLP